MSFKWLDRRAAPLMPYLTLVRSEVDFLKAVKHLKVTSAKAWITPPYADATAHFFNHKDGGRCVIVAINVKEKHDSIEITGLLVHEAVHVVQDYFEGISEHSPATEQQAYAIQAVAQELMAEYARQIGEPT